MSSILPEHTVAYRQEGPHSLRKAVLTDKEFSNHHHPKKTPNQTMEKYPFNCSQAKKITLALMKNTLLRNYLEKIKIYTV